ncbi:major facilitator superfamily domain-containing protein, partial [Suillus americanus]
MEPQPPALLSAPRMLTLIGSVLVSLSSGTNYVPYAPQLGARLLLSHTQTNVIGLAGNMGVYLTGPAWGRVVDSKGPRIPLISAFACILIGYLGIRHIFDNGAGTVISLVVLIACSFMTGLAGNAGLAVAMNTTAKSFPETSRGTTTGLVLSGFGLSAFFFATIASVAFPGDTSALLLVLGLGTAIPMLLGLVIVRQIPVRRSRSRATSAHDGPNVYGKQLWLSSDFYLVFVIMSLLSGTGIMYINNVGSISQALYAKGNHNYDEVEASRWQAAQVSTLSACNFAGRIIIGLIGDLVRYRLRLPRAYCFCIVSTLFVVSQ